MKIKSVESRNSSIELLRIFAACFVVVLHYNGMGKALENSYGINHEVLAILECFCVCSVDLFIMLSGYFLCMTSKRTLDKPIYLLLYLSIIVILSYIINNWNDISFITLIHSVCPPKNYFVIIYITLYVISPYINIALNSLTSKERTILVVITMLFFSIYPTLIDSYHILIHAQPMGTSTVGAWGQQHGYTIIGFTLYYIVGAYIRLNNIQLSQKINIILLMLLVSCIYVWFKFEETIMLKGLSLIEYNSLSYSNPLVIALASILLITFTNIHLRSKVINSLAKASFVCYIFHLNIIPYLKIESYIHEKWILLHLIISVVFIYLISWGIWYVLDFSLQPLIKRLRKYEITSIGQEAKNI